MNIRKLFGTILLVLSAVSSLAQDAAVPAERRMPSAVQFSVQHRAGLAPWLDVRPEKRQYYAYRNYAPPELVAQLDRPVQAPEVRSLLAQRSAAFRSGARRMPLAIDPDSIVNLGTENPNDASSVALVDLGRSPDLLASLTNELRIDAVNNYVLPTVASRFVQERGTRRGYAALDQLLVSVAAKDHSRVRIFELRDGQWVLLSDLTPGAVPNKDPRAIRSRFKARDASLHYQGMEAVAQASMRAPAGEAVIHTVTVNQWRDIASQTGIENPRSLSGTSLTGMSPAGGKAPSTPPPSTTQPSAPPAGQAPATYRSYGQSPWCNRYCSASSCLSCCAAAAAAQHSTAFGASLACHIASDLCPWCHAGCAAMTAAMSVQIATMDTMCVTTCPFGTPAPMNNNPRNCPAN